MAEQLERCIQAELESICALPEDGFLPFRKPCVTRSQNGAVIITALGVYRRAGCLWVPVLNSSRRQGLSLCAYLFRSDQFCGCVRGDISEYMGYDEYEQRMQRALTYLPPDVGAWVSLNQLDEGAVKLAAQRQIPAPAAAPAERWRQMFLNYDGRLVIVALDESKSTVAALVAQLERLQAVDVQATAVVPTGRGDAVERYVPPIPVAANPKSWNPEACPESCEAVIVGRYRHRSCDGVHCMLFAVLVNTPDGLQLVTIVPPGDVAFLPQVPEAYAEYTRDLLRAVCTARDEETATIHMVIPQGAAVRDRVPLVTKGTMGRRHGKKRKHQPCPHSSSPLGIPL